MFNYEEKGHSYTTERNGQINERKVNIYADGVRVGYILQKFTANGDVFPVEPWHKDEPVVYGYCEKDGTYSRDITIGYCRSVIEGKKKFSEWYSEQGNKNCPKADVRSLPASPDAEFFPTPSALAGRMANYIKWEKVTTILEPSAGKGDLLKNVFKCAQRKDRWRDGHWLEITDCVELDTNLSLILQASGFRVVGDDFLSYCPFKSYDLILMNPPFSNGDEHLLKAISLQANSGGQIVCLLNAETIRNPYTNRRKVLAKKLAELEAKIEFIQGAFRRAERRSDVEVAIVYIDAPPKKEKSNIIEGLKKAQEDSMAMSVRTLLFRETGWNSL